MKFNRTCFAVFGLLLSWLGDEILLGQQLNATIVVDGLKNPTAVAVEPETDRVYLVENGALRVVKIVGDQVVPVVTGFATAKLDGVEDGPLGLHFVARGNLLVGHGEADESGQLSRFEFSNETDDTIAKSNESATVIDVRRARQTQPLQLRKDDSKLGGFRSISSQHANIYVVTGGDPEHGWIAMSEFQKEKISSFRPAIATTATGYFLNPTSAITYPEGGYLIVAGKGEEGAGKDSRLAYYSFQGRLLDQFAVELEDVVALAISPNRKHLFAIDHCFTDPSRAGLYKLFSASDGSCAVKKILDIPWAVAMDFDSNGSLYVVTCGGSPEIDGATRLGKLLKIDGLDRFKESSQ